MRATTALAPTWAHTAGRALADRRQNDLGRRAAEHAEAEHRERVIVAGLPTWWEEFAEEVTRAVHAFAVASGLRLVTSRPAAHWAGVRADDGASVALTQTPDVVGVERQARAGRMVTFVELTVPEGAEVIEPTPAAAAEQVLRPWLQGLQPEERPT